MRARLGSRLKTRTFTFTSWIDISCSFGLHVCPRLIFLLYSSFPIFSDAFFLSICLLAFIHSFPLSSNVFAVGCWQSPYNYNHHLWSFSLKAPNISWVINVLLMLIYMHVSLFHLNLFLLLLCQISRLRSIKQVLLLYNL